MPNPLLQEVIPELADEIRYLLEKDDKQEIAEQVSTLRIFERCRCNGNSCATFYTLPKPEAAWGAEHKNIVLDAKKGWLILDVVDKKIACVEVLDRHEIREKLLRQLP